jgi:outer membrane protein TolC
MSTASLGRLRPARALARATLAVAIALLVRPVRAEDAPPRTSAVESLGVGWPTAQPVPAQLGLPDVALEQLSSLSLDQAVQISTQRNPVVRQAYEQLVATQNTLGAAYASWWPVINQSLNGGMDGERAYYNYNGALSGVGAPSFGSYANTRAFSSSYFQSVGQLELTWNLLDPARTPTIWQNKYLVRQAVDTYVIARRDNKLQTEEAFIKLQSANARILTGEQLVANDQLLYRLAQVRMQQGVGSRLEIAKQETVLKTDQVNLVLAQQTAQEAQAVLAQQLAVLQAAAIQPGTPLAPLGSWPHSLEATINASMQYRKVLEQQLMAVKINEAQAQIDLAIYRPTIALVNTLYWTKGVGYTSLGPPWVQNARSDQWNAAALLQISLTGFDGGQARMSAAAAMRQAKASEAAYQAAVNQVRQEAQSFYAQARQGREAVLLAAGRMQAASSALKLQSLRIDAGYGTITDVVQAQQDLTQAVGAYIDVLANYNIALVTLARISGLAYASDSILLERVGDPFANLALPLRLRKPR